jgi:hypothetical protein
MILATNRQNRKFILKRKDIYMFPQILALTVKAGGPDGANVDIGSWPFIIGAMPFIIIIVFIIALFWYFLNKKRLEHQQIMAAIEKGTPLSELRPLAKKGADWIKSISMGIAFSLMGIGIMIVASISAAKKYPDKDAGFGLFVVSVVLLAIGAAGVLSGILKRRSEKELAKENLTLDANHGS